MHTQLSPTTALGGLLDVILPKRCVGCGAAGEWLCAGCAAGLPALPAARCEHCGAPRRPGYAACSECSGRRLWFLSASAAFAYEGPARALVTTCKFRAYRSLVDEMVRRAAPSFTAACERVASDAAAEHAPTVVTWVPGHRGHTLERGFNAAELLARGLAARAGLPAVALLDRVRHGARQSGLGRAARAANVRGTFVVKDDTTRDARFLKRVMIVDDVYTTGETLSHGAEVLINAGLEPHVFTFARTIRAVPSQTSIDNAVRKERCR